jgi:hypothetical protein
MKLPKHESESMDLMPKKVPLLLFAAMIGIVLSIFFLIQLLSPELPYDLGDIFWIWDEEAGLLPSLVNYIILIAAILLLLVGLCAILIHRGIACLLLAISGFLFALLLYVAIIVLPFWYWY